MSDRNLRPERAGGACLTHLRQRRVGVSFSRYCRERDLKFQQWAWVKRVLIRKGVIGERRRPGRRGGGICTGTGCTAAAAATMCRIRHPSGWTIECASFPEVSWMSALMSEKRHDAPWGI